jgi:hypothetical protein
LNGESFRAISSESGCSPAAGSRHWRQCVRPELRRSAPPAHVAGFAARLLDIADSAADERERARARHDGRLVLAAMRAEREAISELTNVLGIDDEEVVTQLAEARALVLAVRDAVLDSHPELAERLARDLTGKGQPELADALLSLVREPGPHHLHAIRDTPPKEIQ